MQNRWSDEEADGLSDLELLVYQSRLLGEDPALVLWGGGNTSLKVTETDFRGRPTSVMRIKASGSDMKSCTPADFPALRLDDILPLFEREAMSDEEMVAYLGRCMLDPASPRPSIETLLHAFLPHSSIVHSHADAVIAMTNNANAGQALKDAFGGAVGVVEYLRPGFALAKRVGEVARANPGLRGVALSNHGLIYLGRYSQSGLRYPHRAGYDGRGSHRQRRQGRAGLWRAWTEDPWVLTTGAGGLPESPQP